VCAGRVTIYKHYINTQLRTFETDRYIHEKTDSLAEKMEVSRGVLERKVKSNWEYTDTALPLLETRSETPFCSPEWPGESRENLDGNSQIGHMDSFTYMNVNFSILVLWPHIKHLPAQNALLSTLG